MNTGEIMNEVSRKTDIDEVFEEFLGSNILDEMQEHDMLEAERIAAIAECINQNSAIPNIHGCMIVEPIKEETPIAGETESGNEQPDESSAAPDDSSPIVMIEKVTEKRTLEEILKDILEEESFFEFEFCETEDKDEFYEDFYDEEIRSEPMETKIQEADVTAVPVIEPEPVVSPAPLIVKTEQKTWKIYFTEKTRTLKEKIKSYLNFNSVCWNLNFSNGMMAKSAYVALCILISIPFGIVAAHRLSASKTDSVQIETSVQSPEKQKTQEQVQAAVQPKPQTQQIPTVPQPVQNMQQPMPQNLQIVKPEAENTAKPDTQLSQNTTTEQPVYTPAEVYEQPPVYDYYYTEAVWVEPTNEMPTNNNANIQPNPEITKANETQKTEPAPQVNAATQNPPPQNKIEMLEPVPYSDAFMKPVSQSAPSK